MVLLLALSFVISISSIAKSSDTTGFSFRQWLFEYIPSQYSNAKMTDHSHWLQAHIGDDLVVSWTQWNEEGVTLKYLESHALKNGRTIFIEKRDKTNWDSHSAVTYINGTGYYISGYDSATMSSWKVEGCNIIQFDGDARMFVEKMGKAWADAHSFKWWLFRNLPTMYPNTQMIDHTYWLQGRISDQQSVNWTEWTDNNSTFKAMEAHNLIPGKAMFIEQKGPKIEQWANHPAVTWFKGSGYYISGYDPATMGSWDGKGLTVIQFDGDCEEIAQTIALAWVRKNSFENWLYQFIPMQYSNARMSIHFNKWMQAHITDHIVASWEQWDVKGITLKEIEPESLTQGKAFFIEQKGPKKELWANHPAVTHYEGAGYYCSGYDQATMRTWGVEGLTVIQFDGDCAELARTIALAWVKGNVQTVATHKPRVIITTDLGADPDDEQSMVRYLVCSNEFDTEGLIVSTGCWKKSQNTTVMLDKLIDAYAQVYDNIKVHADGYPTPEHLKSISVLGQRGYGMGDVGNEKDSPGSDMIIASVDKDDPRPVWVGGWGGVNNVAQAVWKVQHTRSEAELARFISKLRVFDILGQDDAGAWLAKNYPDLFYIRATGVYGWQPPKNGDYQKNDIQSHGPLGAAYPNTKWATEGDTPAYMHVYPNGLNDPDQIDQGSWGGRFSFVKKAGIRSMSEVAKINNQAETQFDPYYMYGNTPEGASAIKRWSKGYDNDFAARMDWTMTNDYSKVNHHPAAVVNGDKTRQVLNVSAATGSKVVLDTEGSRDPDGNSLNYAWSFYKEPSSYNGDVSILYRSSSSATVEVPADASGKNIHIILELYDDGLPNLYAYRRIIINVK